MAKAQMSALEKNNTMKPTLIIAALAALVLVGCGQEKQASEQNKDQKAQIQANRDAAKALEGDEKKAETPK